MLMKSNLMTILLANVRLLALALLLFSAPTVLAQGTAPIRKVLDEQVAAWNDGNLEEFMKSYWHSDELTFFSGARRLNGWEATLERYRRTYQADGKEMGRLTFNNLNIRLLGSQAAFARGEYHLTFNDGRNATGIFTLVLQRFPAGWKIVHDHTSAAD